MRGSAALPEVESSDAVSATAVLSAVTTTGVMAASTLGGAGACEGVRNVCDDDAVSTVLVPASRDASASTLFAATLNRLKTPHTASAPATMRRPCSPLCREPLG